MDELHTQLMKMLIDLCEREDPEAVIENALAAVIACSFEIMECDRSNWFNDRLLAATRKMEDLRKLAQDHTPEELEQLLQESRGPIARADAAIDQFKAWLRDRNNHQD